MTDYQKFINDQGKNTKISEIISTLSKKQEPVTLTRKEELSTPKPLEINSKV